MGRAKARKIDYFFLLNVWGIARESASILVQNLCFFTSIAVVLLSPVSAALFLSRALLPGNFLVTDLSQRIREFGRAAGIPTSNAHQICDRLSETIICYALCFPLVITLSLFARATVARAVGCSYSGNKPSFDNVREALSLWKQMVITYIVAGALILGANAAVFVVVSAVIKVLSIVGFSSEWVLRGVVLGGVIVYSIVFAHTMIVLNLATIVCAVEGGKCGLECVLRAVYLIRGRTRIALVMAAVVNLSWAFVESLFEYRVVGMGRDWEGPLLLLMYSMVSVMDVVMSAVFYYTCKSCRMEVVFRAMDCCSFASLHNGGFERKTSQESMRDEV